VRSYKLNFRRGINNNQLEISINLVFRVKTRYTDAPFAEMAAGHGLHTGQRGLLDWDQLFWHDNVPLRTQQSGDPGDVCGRH